MGTTVSYTYTELLAEIQAWVDDDSTEFVAALPNIIRLAESQVATDLGLDIFDAVTTGNLTASQPEQDILGSDVQQVQALWIRDADGTGLLRALRHRTYAFCLDYAPDPAVEAEPKFWAYVGENDDVTTRIYLSPTPDDTYEFTLRFTGPPEGLSSTNSNTWIGDNAGDLLLWQALYKAESWLKSDQAQRWFQQYAQLMQTRMPTLQESMRTGDFTSGRPPDTERGQ